MIRFKDASGRDSKLALVNGDALETVETDFVPCSLEDLAFAIISLGTDELAELSRMLTPCPEEAPGGDQ